MLSTWTPSQLYMPLADKHARYPLAVEIRTKTIELSKSTTITYHWIKRHAGVQGNERSDYLAKIVASYKSTIDYTAIPKSRGKQILEEHYTEIWNAIYINAEAAGHTKLFIPSIFHRKSISIKPNFILSQFLTNHGNFRSYLHKIKKAPSPFCSCADNILQTVQHLLQECTLFSKDRPSVARNLPLHQILKHHINSVPFTKFMESIFRQLQD